MWESAERAFRAYGIMLETFALFKYLGKVLTKGENDWPEVVGNLKKARKSWAWLMRILGREGANPRVSGMFFKWVVHVVFLFGSEMCLLIPRMGRDLGIFQHRVARRNTGRQPRIWE